MLRFAPGLALSGREGGTAWSLSVGEALVEGAEAGLAGGIAAASAGRAAATGAGSSVAMAAGATT